VKWVCVAVFLTGCILSPVYRFGGGKSSKQAQNDQAGKLAPPALGVDDEYEGDVKTAKLRVWADDDFRAQNVRWQQTFQELLDHANEIVASQFGVRFVVEYRSWSYRAAPGEPIETTLAALGAADPGSDVFAVVGLTGALTLVESSFERLGFAALPGKHMILRGYADQGERAAFDRVFKDLDVTQRDALHRARRRHKMVAVFLHELGHNLGAAHRDQPNTLMNPIYQVKAATFDAASRDAIQVTLDRRLGRASRPTRAVPQGGDHPTLVIVLDDSGNRLVGGNILDEPTLDGLLRLHYTDDHETAVTIKAQSKTPMTSITSVVDRAKAAGLTRISISRE
jgi:biopolymer transport protein ExbD